MRTFKTFLFVVVMACAGAFVTACNDDEEPPTMQNLEVSNKILFFTPETEAGKSIEVYTSSTTVAVEPGYPDWIRADAVGKTVNVMVAELSEAQGRDADIVIIAGNEKATVRIVQAGTEDALEVEKNSFDFMPFPTVPKAFTIKGNVLDFEYEGVPAWLKITSNGNSVIMTAEDNTSVRERSAEIMVYSGTKFTQFRIGQRGNTSFVISRGPEYVGDMYTNSISPNGRYVVGQRQSRSFVWDVELDEFYYTSNGDLYGVADTGLAVGVYKYKYTKRDGKNGQADLSGTYDFRTDTWTAMDASIQGLDVLGNPEDAGMGYSLGAISADGTIVGGAHGKNPFPAQAEYMWELPMIWTNGTAKMLEYNTVDLLGQEGLPPQRYKADKMSADGTRMFGRQVEWIGTENVCYWDLPEGKLTILGEKNKDIVDAEFFQWNFDNDGKPIGFNAIYRKTTEEGTMSWNGRYIASQVVDHMRMKSFPLYWDIQTGNYSILTDAGSPILVTDEGYMFYGSGGIRVFDGTNSIDLNTWLNENYEITPADATYFNRGIREASQNGKVFAGGHQDSASDGNVTFIISLPR